jgi:hypothetical protein
LIETRAVDVEDFITLIEIFNVVEEQNAQTGVSGQDRSRSKLVSDADTRRREENTC